MSTIPGYPPPPGALDGSELILGFTDGKTIRIPTGMLVDLVLSSANLDAALASWLAGLPTVPPVNSRQWWNNDGIPTRTP